MQNPRDSHIAYQSLVCIGVASTLPDLQYQTRHVIVAEVINLRIRRNQF